MIIPLQVNRILRRMFDTPKDPLYEKVNDALAVIIIISVVLIVLESVNSLRVAYQQIFQISEWIVVSIFTLEYLIYTYLARQKLRYIFSLFGIIDLLAILPTYASFLLPPFAGFTDLRVLRVLRVLRLLRIFRILKFLRYVHHPKLEKGVWREIPWHNLQIYFFSLFCVVVISGTLVYVAESRIEDTTFVDIPAGMWWAIVTLTTTGYGDMVPQTAWGRIIAVLTMFCGLALFALLVVVAGKFLQKLLFGGPVDAEK